MPERDRTPKLVAVPGGVSDTMPPQRAGQVSGKYRVREWIERRKATPEQLRNPTIGGILLRSLPAWTDLLSDDQKAIEVAVLDFIAKEEIPSDEDISIEIERLHKNKHTQKLMGEVETTLAKFRTLPDDVVIQIKVWMRHFISEHPEAGEIDVTRETIRMGDLAVVSMSEHHSIRPSASPAEEANEGRSTYPDIPSAIEKAQKKTL